MSRCYEIFAASRTSKPAMFVVSWQHHLLNGTDEPPDDQEGRG